MASRPDPRSTCRRIWERLPKRVVVVYGVTLAVGLLAFAAQNLVLHRPVQPVCRHAARFPSRGARRSVGFALSAEAWRQAVASVLMIVTVQDPPRFDWRSLLVIGGFGLSVLGLLRVPFARRLAARRRHLLRRGGCGRHRRARQRVSRAVFGALDSGGGRRISMLSFVSLQEATGWRLGSRQGLAVD